MTTINPGISSSVRSAPAAFSGATSTSSTGSAADRNSIASNFQNFLTLLTTQLKNQNPLDPLDTNQFTQQLVSFSQVEQQLKMNDQLSTLVSLQQSAQTTTALAFVGSTVTVDGTSAQLKNGGASWLFTAAKPASVKITITDSTGQTAYSGTFTVQAGTQSFSWDGRGNNGAQWPDGAYKMTVAGRDSSGQAVAISTQVQGTVDSVDLTQNPPTLSIAGQTYNLNQVKSVVRQ